MAAKKKAVEPICPNCRVPYARHPGLRSTCAALQCALDALRQIATLPRAGRFGRIANATIQFLESQLPTPEPAQKFQGFTAHAVGANPKALAVLEGIFKQLGIKTVDATIKPHKKTKI